jgi:hypothetical protein
MCQQEGLCNLTFTWKAVTDGNNADTQEYLGHASNDADKSNDVQQVFNHQAQPTATTHNSQNIVVLVSPAYVSRFWFVAIVVEKHRDYED